MSAFYLQRKLLLFWLTLNTFTKCQKLILGATLSFSLFNQTLFTWNLLLAPFFALDFDLIKNRVLYTRKPNFKAWTIFFDFQNAGRQDATRESITGDDSLTEYRVLIYRSICTDIYYWAWTSFLLNRFLKKFWPLGGVSNVYDISDMKYGAVWHWSWLWRAGDK